MFQKAAAVFDSGGGSGLGQPREPPPGRQVQLRRCRGVGAAPVQSQPVPEPPESDFLFVSDAPVCGGVSERPSPSLGFAPEVLISADFWCNCRFFTKSQYIDLTGSLCQRQEAATKPLPDYGMALLRVRNPQNQQLDKDNSEGVTTIVAGSQFSLCSPLLIKP